ncbi:MAG: hypothetical protein K0S99_303 [Thermomicrobiales bacterium]|nr:hypothetical protein [Thermomicrobiales bacterium]
MSFQAVYDVTRALRHFLRSQLVPHSSSAVVTLLPPGDTLPDVSGVNLFLYRVLESPFTKNEPWRGDSATPPSDRCVLALQLFYLVTPLGVRPVDDAFQLGDEAHSMLGAAMLALHENPILNDIHLPTFDADDVLPRNLLLSYEQIKVMLLPTPVEELSKIWAAINKPYRLSVAYEVSLVELTPTIPPPAGGGIVLTPHVDVFTLDPPRLSALTPASGALARLVGTDVRANRLVISGFGFSFPGQKPRVRVGGQTVTVRNVPAPTDTALTVILPTSVEAGPVVDVTVTLNRRTSTPLAFVITPWLVTTTPIRSALDPSRPEDLTLNLTGEGFAPGPMLARFSGQGTVVTSPATAAAGSTTQATAPIPTTLTNGNYEVRLQTGPPAASLSNPRPLEILPRLNAPPTVKKVTVAGKQVHRLQLTGARLSGGDVRLIIDDVPYAFKATDSVSATALTMTLGRVLDPGTHRLAVTVDGHLGRAIDLVIP